MIGAFVLIVALAVGGRRHPHRHGGFTTYMFIVLGVMLGGLVAFIIFGRRAQKSVYSKAEGQTGAGGLGAGQLAGQVAVTHRRRATGHFDAVHR